MGDGSVETLVLALRTIFYTTHTTFYTIRTTFYTTNGSTILISHSRAPPGEVGGNIEAQPERRGTR